MEIVPFVKSDQNETQKFMEAIFEESGWLPEPEDGLNDLEKYFKIPENGSLFVVKTNNIIGGSGGFIKIDSITGLIKRFYLAKSYRGLGVATKLLQEIVASAKTMGLNRLVLDVSKNNPRAIKFYEKSGFTKYDQSPIDGWPESSLPDTYYFYFLDLD